MAQGPTTQAYYNAVSFTQNNPIQVGSANLVMQSDGNFVMYYPGGSWSTLTAKHDCSQGCHAEFQPDGNLVLYNGTSWFWASHTDGKGSQLILSQNAPYVSIIDPQGSTIWAAVPSFNDLILPQNASVLFNSRTLTMQGDGNLVLHNDLGVPVWNLGTAGQNCGDSGCAAYVVGGQLNVYAGSNLIYQSPAGGLTLATDQPYVRVGGTPIGNITDAGCISTQDQRNVAIETLINLQSFSTKFTNPSNTRNDLAFCITGINRQVNIAGSQQWTCTATGATVALEEICGIQLRTDLIENTSPGTGGIQKNADGFTLVGPDDRPVPTIIWDQAAVISSAAGLQTEFVGAFTQLSNSSYSIPGLSFSAPGILDASGGAFQVGSFWIPGTPGFFAVPERGGIVQVTPDGLVVANTPSNNVTDDAKAVQEGQDALGHGYTVIPYESGAGDGCPYCNLQPGDTVPGWVPKGGEQPAQ